MAVQATGVVRPVNLPRVQIYTLLLRAVALGIRAVARVIRGAVVALAIRAVALAIRGAVVALAIRAVAPVLPQLTQNQRHKSSFNSKLSVQIGGSDGVMSLEQEP